MQPEDALLPNKKSPSRTNYFLLGRQFRNFPHCETYDLRRRERESGEILTVTFQLIVILEFLIRSKKKNIVAFFTRSRHAKVRCAGINPKN